MDFELNRSEAQTAMLALSRFWSRRYEFNELDSTDGEQVGLLAVEKTNECVETAECIKIYISIINAQNNLHQKFLG